jgi:hypothetical protein
MRSPALAAALAGLLVAPVLDETAAQSPETPPVPGSELTVYVMTMGQGDLVWERYGHNAIGIRNALTNSDVVYNWGMFSFSQPGFIGRFLRGDMMYWMEGFDAQQTLANYQFYNRTVEIQELNLSPPQRLALLEHLTWNALEENKFYRYDYFRDNCSTRVRDALDRILGGAIRMATDSVPTGTTYRWHSLRLMAEDPLTSIGINIGLGRPTDRPITAWEEMFIPMKVRDRLREIRVPDDSGRLVPLVTSERTLFTATREAERTVPPNRLPLLAAIGLALAGVLWRIGQRAGRAAVAGAITVAVMLGITGGALAFLRLFTEHVAAWNNTNMFVYNPLWLLVAAVMPWSNAGFGRTMARGAASFAGICAAIGLVAPFIPGFIQHSYAVVLLAAPAAFVATWIIRERTQPRPAATTTA